LNSSDRASEGKALPWALLNDLTCPCCGSRLDLAFEVQSSQDGLEDGVLRCDCYEYPVVAGIAVLRQMSPVSSTQNEAVDRLRHRDPGGALQWLLENGSGPGVPGLGRSGQQVLEKSRVLRWLKSRVRGLSSTRSDKPIPLQDGFQAALRASRPRHYADYLYHRLANPSFLGAIPPLVVVGDKCRQKKDGRILDLLCGVGLADAIVSALCPGLEVVAADSDFVNLYLARNFTLSRAVILCIDAEHPLPLANDSVDGLWCIDGLHYLRSKMALLSEVDRVVAADGTWLFAHMHNAKGMNENPGTPLPADGYAKRFSFGSQRLMGEPEILRQFQTEGCLDLTAQADVDSLASSHALTLAGARTDTLWDKHAGLDDALCRRPDLLGFNPIYEVEKAADGLNLGSAWPSDSLRLECIGKIPILPETVHVPSRVVDEIAALRTSSSLSDDVRKLLRSFVLVSLPDCYPRPGLSLQG
jgi:SAM-dependent methyltransferase